MGMLQNAMSGDKFRLVFNQVLMGSHYVTLFDHAWATAHGAGYHSTVYKYSVAAGYVPMEFEGKQVCESSLVKSICTASMPAHPDLSSFRKISSAMEERNSGLIIVHNAHMLSDKAVHLLARLVTFTKRKKLDWKIILFAESTKLNHLNLAQLAVEKSFPDPILELKLGADKTTEIKHRDINLGQTGRTIKYVVGAVLGLLAIAIGLKLIY